MSTKSTVQTPADTLNTVQALFDIYFASAERLTGLTLATARKTLEDSTTAAKALSGLQDARDLGALQAALGQPAFDRAIAYSRDSFAIIAQAQAEAVDILKQASAVPQLGLPASPDWNAAFAAFTRGARQLSEMTSANMAAVSAAGAKQLAEAKSAQQKAA